MEQEILNKIYSKRARLKELIIADKSLPDRNPNDIPKVQIRNILAELRALGDTDYIESYSREYWHNL